MSVVDDTRAYEEWLRGQCQVVERGLRKKHKRMARDAFMFFRATVYRFARKVPTLLPQLWNAPLVPGVGDAHIENWGTWRDGEGRLVWGVNDFDEAAILPYTQDLLRLATSAQLAPGLPDTKEERAAAILAGYCEGLHAPGPRFIDDETPWMQRLINRPATKSGSFRTELAELDTAEPPSDLAEALRTALPPGTDRIAFGSWQRGGGSLGRPRYIATGVWRGGWAVREAKAFVPSAWSWASAANAPNGLLLSMATGRYRSPDPFLQIHAGFLIRRLASDSTKIDLTAKDADAYGKRLLSWMGADLAAIHLGSPDVSVSDATAILDDLRQREDGWLHAAATEASIAVQKDFDRWRRFHENGDKAS